MENDKKAVNSRIYYYDNAKALLIFLVVLGHILQYANRDYSILPFSLIQCFIYSFHMPAFFMISGMLFNLEKWKKKHFRSFIISRLKLLMLPYLFFEVIGLIVNSLLLHMVTMREGLLNIITIRCNVGADWFLPAMFTAQCLYLIIKKYMKNSYGMIAMLLCMVFLIYMPINGYWAVLFRGLLGLLFMNLGSTFKGTAEKLLSRDKWEYTLLSLILTMIFAVLSFKYAKNDFYLCMINNPIILICGSICGTYMILSLSKFINSLVLSYFGKNSLIVMGTHQIFLYIIGPLNGVIQVITVFILIVLAEIPIIYILNKWFPNFVGK